MSLNKTSVHSLIQKCAEFFMIKRQGLARKEQQSGPPEYFHSEFGVALHCYIRYSS